MVSTGSTVLLLCLLCACHCSPIVDTCDIFCHGPLLESVQMAKLFKDCKYFVDMSLKQNPLVTMEAFLNIKNKSDPKVLQKFVEQYFDEPGSELETCIPSDWKPMPSSFYKIADPLYRFWAMMINERWSNLCRKVKREVHLKPELYSLIPVARPFIIPGGRFLEYYYWDSYWIIKGLMASEMYNSAKDMILNLLSMVDRFGFVPNGGRIYYLNRSQPPLLILCVYDYYKATGDFGFLRYVLPMLEKEYQFWVRERTVPFKFNPKDEPVRMYQYRVIVEQPRSESYREDKAISDDLPDVEDKNKMWSNIASACESGWDFSSRWFKHSGPNMDTLKAIRTTRVVPVDLNAYMCGNERMLSELYKAVGKVEAAFEHENNYQAQKRVMSDFFWDPEDKIWFDLDLDTGQRIKLFYTSNTVPLFTKCFNDDFEYDQAVLDYLDRVQALKSPHGLPTSLQWTDEQWDRPNGWPPNNHMVIEGLRASKNPQIQERAFQLARTWLEVNYAVFIRSGGKMFEKYNVESDFSAGGGGEYDVQEGFGWTNGVVLDILLNYGNQLRAPLLPVHKEK